MDLKIKRLHADVKLPVYATDVAAGFDLHCYAPGKAPLAMGLHADAATFDTGLSVEIPPGQVMLIFSRSGHGFNHDLRLANCVGVIDSDYRGQVAVRLTADFDQASMDVGHGDRIAQAMLVPIERVTFIQVEELSDTARGAGGFGSTGQ